MDKFSFYLYKSTFKYVQKKIESNSRVIEYVSFSQFAKKQFSKFKFKCKQL
jgi:hypothetical protein